MRIAASEPAVDALLAYELRSSAHAQRLQDALGALGSAHLGESVLRLRGVARPIWVSRIDDETHLYLTYGHGEDADELRIVFVGASPGSGTIDLSLIAQLAGEVMYSELGRDVALEEHRQVATVPELPERIVEPEETLDGYLHPSEDVLLAAIDRHDGGGDDLHGRRFRMLGPLVAPGLLPIRLSPQQERILRQPLPLLIQGVAGSGKTSVVARFAHQQFLRGGEKPKLLLVVYTAELRDFMVSLLRSLDAVEQVDSTAIEVATWRDLCTDLAASVGLGPLRWAPANFYLDQLRAHLRSVIRGRQVAPVAEDVYEYVRSQIKGELLLDLSEPIPSRRAVLQMKHPPLGDRIDATVIYDAAEKYQHALAVQGLRDDADVARALLADPQSLPTYDFVMVDEAQDYMLIQVLLFTHLVGSPAGLLFAGDSDQVLYRSRFRWEHIRSALWKVWKIRAPAPQTIEYNYRNPQPVTDLANAVLDIRSRQLSLAPAMEAQSNQPLTPRPLRFVGSRSEIDGLIDELASKVGSLCVISRAQPEARTIGGIEFSRWFTPQTIKGLEFEVVCLLDFGRSYRHLLASGGSLSRRRQILEFNELYVSMTRTRSQLLLLDTIRIEHDVWSDPTIEGRIDETEGLEALRRLVAARFENRTRQDWISDARDLESQLAYTAAGECWERAGVLAEAARCYEAAESWRRALDIYRVLDDLPSSARMLLAMKDLAGAAKTYERGALHRKAADLWASLNENLKAAVAYTAEAVAGSDDAWSLAGTYFSKANQHARAGECYERAGDLGQAVQCWLDVGDLLRAAQLQERLGRVIDAAKSRATYHEREGHHRMAAEQWMIAKEFRRATAQFEAAGDIPAALDAIGHVDDPREEARLLVLLGRYETAARRLAQAHDAAEAAQLFERASMPREAATQWMSAKRYRQAATLYEAAGDIPAALDAIGHVDDPREEARLLVLLGRYETAASSLARAHDIPGAAELLERAGMAREAANHWVLAREYRRAATLYEAAGDLPAAVDTIRRVDDPDEEARLRALLRREIPPRPGPRPPARRWTRLVLRWLRGRTNG